MTVIDMAATGQNIRAMRVAAGMTIRDVMNVCGVSAAAAPYAGDVHSENRRKTGTAHSKRPAARSLSGISGE